MDTKRRAFVVLAALSIFSCGKGAGTQTPQASLPIMERIGWTHGACLAISNPNLVAGAPLALVMMTEPQAVRTATIRQKTISPAACPALLEGRASMNTKPGVSFYSLDTSNVDPTDMGIGILSPPLSEITATEGKVLADLNRDGHKQVFSSCTTTEGIRFAIWNDKAYQGQPLWSGYYYLNYDTTPSCPAP